jgi:hypothetical protein
MCRFTFGECPIITRFEGSFVYLIGSLIIGVDHIDSGYDSYFARLKLNLVPISSPFSALPELHLHFLSKFLHLHFVFAKLNKGILLH